MSTLNVATDVRKQPSRGPDWGLRVGFYLFILVTAGIMTAAWLVRDARYLLPDSGLGYALGITGCLLMLLLLVYPLRKRLKALQSWWTIAGWFRLHMLLGVLGPCLILLHSNFSLGSTNSTVALVAMLLVAGSGLVGRYFYGKFHNGLYGEQLKLAQLRGELDGLFAGLAPLQQTDPQRQIIDELHQGCGQIVDSQQRGLSFRQLVSQRKWLRDRRKLTKKLSAALPELAQRWRELYKLMDKLAGLALFERLFGIWHVVHIPVFAVMVITAVVHIFVVHWY